MFRRDLIKAFGAAPFLSVGDLLKTPDYVVYEFDQQGTKHCKSYHVIKIVYNDDCNPEQWVIPLQKWTKEKYNEAKMACEKSMLESKYKKMICINIENEDNDGFPYVNCFYIDYNIVDLNASKLFNPIIRDGYVTL